MVTRNNIAVAAMIVFLLIGLVGGYYIGQATYPLPEEKPFALMGEFKIGVLEAAEMGHIRPTVEILQEEIDDFLDLIGANFSVTFIVEDAQTSADRALELIQDMYAQGIRVVLCIPWTSHISAVKSYADENHILVISGGSTSPTMAVPNDFIYRLAPNDTLQASCLNSLHLELGIEAMVILSDANAWGDALSDALSTEFSACGGTVCDRIRYDEAATDFSAEVALLASKVEEAIGIYGQDKVAVEFISPPGVDAVMVVTAAQYPVLLEVPWIDADGNAQDAALIDQAGARAVQTGHFCPQYAPVQSQNYLNFYNKFVGKTGFPPLPYVVNTYDAGWITVLSILAAESYDADAIRDVFEVVTSRYFGASGWTYLNTAGDRFSANYVIYAVTNEEDPRWEIVGMFDVTSKSFTWYKDVSSLPIP